MSTRPFAVVLMVAALFGPAVAAARVVRLTCRDGIVPPLPRCVAGCSRPVRCDADEQCDRTCTVAIRVCGEVACFDHLVGVPVGQRQKISVSVGCRLCAAAPGRPMSFLHRRRLHGPPLLRI